MRTWIKDPLAIFADGAERGLVVEGSRIAERVGRGETPERIDATSTLRAMSCCRDSSIPTIISTRR